MEDLGAKVRLSHKAQSAASDKIDNFIAAGYQYSTRIDVGR